MNFKQRVLAGQVDFNRVVAFRDGSCYINHAGTYVKLFGNKKSQRILDRRLKKNESH